MRRKAKIAASIATLTFGGAPATAHAASDGFMLNPGFLLSAVGGPSPATFAYGGEVSFMWFPNRLPEPGYGGFAQWQKYGGDEGRWAFGAQAGSILGVELGWAYRETSPYNSWTTGAHLALYLSGGFASMAIRGTIPVAEGHDPGKPPHGGEIALAFTLKFPIPLAGDPIDFRMPSGRPLRSGGAERVPDVVRAKRARRLSPRVEGLDEATRASKAKRWLDDARLEHASVAAFAKLSLELMAQGAPPSLVARAHRAALDEIKHAELCFALAGAYAGEPLAAGALDVGAIMLGDRDAIALESFVDGCLGEARAAAEAHAEHAREDDPVVRRVLAVIAKDEARHAKLARDIVAWCAKRR